jgi:uncharacterized lipoprotein NlpE involved in copper resistance
MTLSLTNHRIEKIQIRKIDPVKFTIIAISALLIIASCNNNPKTSASEETTEDKAQTKAEAPDQHTSQNSLDWAGTYAGTLPCADCKGIEATVVLNTDQTYHQTFVYQGKKDSSFKEEGKFTWNKGGNTITLISKASPSFRVKEGSIVMLDSDGNEITGVLADKYILKKK